MFLLPTLTILLSVYPSSLFPTTVDDLIFILCRSQTTTIRTLQGTLRVHHSMKTRRMKDMLVAVYLSGSFETLRT